MESKPVDLIAWHVAPLAIDISVTEFEQAQRFCTVKTMLNPTGQRALAIGVLCRSQGQANAAAEVIRLATLDARQRAEIQLRQGHLIANEVARILAQATERR
jgi:hypothetical protein